MAPVRNAQLEQEKEEYRASITEALQEDEDPLAAYDDFVKWTLQQYSADDVSSGLIELLEECTRRFRDDLRYKGDLRYLKLWSAYAKQVEKPTVIYSYLIKHEIGCVYALLYEEFAGALEKEGRHTEADKVFRIGITRNARPIERLKKRYRDFQARPSSSKSAPITFQPSGSQEIDTLRRNPLKNYNSPSPSSSSNLKPSSSSSPSAPQVSSPSPTAHARYAPMLAPPVPGRRPEKLRFILSLLFTEDGVEYSAPEVRARSMGLLNKKWGPPPPSEARETVQVNFNDEGTRSTQNMGYGKRKSIVVGEPTVTINTKEALADVFGMYNSPDKTVKRMVPGSKHAPVKRIEPMKPATRQASPVVHVENNENAKTPGAFKPFVDENANHKENSTPAAKFKPFADEPLKQTFITPDSGRRALTTKESTTATSIKQPATLKSISEEAAGRENENINVKANVFSRVFTPVSQKEPLTRPNSHGTKVSPRNEKAGVLQPPISKPDAAPFVPFESKAPFRVFSRPPPHEGSENAGHVFVPKQNAFRPFTDSGTVATPENLLERRAPLGSKPPASVTYVDEPSESADDPQQNLSSSDEPFEDGFVEADDGVDVPLSSSSSVSDQFEEEYEEEPPQPLGGRFGKINVMTPITERTFEFSTRGLPTPGEKDAVEAAERLAAELREEEERERGYVLDGDESDSSFASYDRPGLALQYQPVGLEAIEERTGTLSLSDALAVVSTFRPSNPCNPFDPAIMSTLLSLLPADQDFHDLRGQDSGMFDGLQDFAAKKSRRGSGSSPKGFDDDAIIITLEGKRLKVMDKLGEGGFGAVFAARDVSSKDEDEEEEDFDEDDDDDDSSSMLALKVVKPRNLWEFHVLRRIHRTLPENLRRSIILPYALYAYHDESYLLMQLCPQGTLLNIVNCAGTAGISQQGACLDELLVMFFTIELMRFLEGMHNAGFIHGDLKIDNCLLRLEDVPGGASALSSIYQPSGDGGWKYKGIKVIDFGRALDTCLFPHGQQFIGDWPTDARDCFELRENRPWTYQTDYFGLAGIIYCMLFGKYIDVSSVTPKTPYKITTPFKRYWQNDLWTRLFDLLLNPCLVHEDGKLPLCEELADIRHEMEGWLQNHCNRSSNTLKGLLKKIELSVYTG